MDREQYDRQYEYFAFISYKREDEKWAKWLQHKLEYYKVPISIRRDNPDVPERIRPVFKDTTDLAPGVLAEKIREALSSSQYLIVICSPRAANSVWVSKEVQAFIDSGREDKIIPFIIGGAPNAENPEDECFPEGLRQLSGEKELLGANVNEMGRDAAAIKVISRMFNLRFDALWQRHEKNRRKRLLGIIAVSIAAIIAAILMGFLLIERTKTLQERDRTIIERDKAYEIVSQTNQELKLSRDKLMAVNKELKQSNENLRLAQDSIKSANKKIIEKADSLWKSRLALEREKAERSIAEVQKALQERSSAEEKSASLLAEGNVIEAIKVILDQMETAAPYNYSPRLERNLRTACDILESDSPKLIQKYPLEAGFGEDVEPIRVRFSSEQGKVVVSNYETNIIDLKTGKSLHSLMAFDGIEILPGGATGVGYGDNRIVWFDVRTGETQIVEPEVKSNNVQLLAISKNGDYIYVLDHFGDSSTIILDAHTGRKVGSTSHFFNEDDLYPDGKSILVSANGEIKRIDLFENTEELLPYKGQWVDLAQDGETIIIRNEEVTRIVNPKASLDASLIGAALDYPFYISPEKNYFIAGNIMFDLLKGAKAYEFPDNGISYFMPPGGEDIYMFDYFQNLSRYHLTAKHPLWSPTDYPYAYFGSTFSGFSDFGEVLINPTSYNSNIMREKWELGDSLRFVGKGEAAPNPWEEREDIYFYNIDKSRYAIIDGKNLKVVSTADGKQIGSTIRPQSEVIYYFSFSPDSKYLMVSSSGRPISIYDIQTGTVVFELPYTAGDGQEGFSAFDKNGNIHTVKEDRLEHRPFHSLENLKKHAKKLISQ